MAFSVAQRTPEIGIRMALGAEQGHVRRQVLREGALLTAGGLTLGVAGAYALGRAMQSTFGGTGALNVPVAGRERHAHDVCARRLLRAGAPCERGRSDDRAASGLRIATSPQRPDSTSGEHQ